MFQNCLQPELPMSREYYVEPQFYAQLEDRADMIRGLLAEFTIVILQNPQDHLEDVQRVRFVLRSSRGLSTVELFTCSCINLMQK